MRRTLDRLIPQPTSQSSFAGLTCPRHAALYALPRVLGELLLLLALCWPALPAHATHAAATTLAPPTLPVAIDLPACEQSAPGSATPWSLGVVQPGASDDVLQYAARLTLARDDVQACQEGWHQVLPRFTPLARELERGHGLAIYALAFILVAVGLRALTPRAWWHRTRALGLLALGGLTWVLGTLLLAGFHLAQGQRLVYGTVVSLRAPQQAVPLWHSVTDARALEAWLAQQGIDTRLPRASPAAAAAATAPLADGPPTQAAQRPAEAGTPPKGHYRVAHRLNLRAGPGTQHPMLTTLSRGDTVTVTGPTQGDWWPIQTTAGLQGWASSLWLRRMDEGLPKLDGAQRG